MKSKMETLVLPSGLDQMLNQSGNEKIYDAVKDFIESTVTTHLEEKMRLQKKIDELSSYYERLHSMLATNQQEKAIKYIGGKRRGDTYTEVCKQSMAYILEELTTNAGTDKMAINLEKICITSKVSTALLKELKIDGWLKHKGELVKLGPGQLSENSASILLQKLTGISRRSILDWHKKFIRTKQKKTLGNFLSYKFRH